MTESYENQLQIIEPTLAELLPTPGAQVAFEDASAAIEAGILVRELRKAAGLTQSGLAQRLGVTQARVSAIETGEGRDGPSYALLKRLAKACNTEWPLRGPTEVPAEPQVQSSRKYASFSFQYPTGKAVSLELSPRVRRSKRKETLELVLNAARKKVVGKLVEVVIVTQSGATSTKVHYNSNEAAFVSDTGREKKVVSVYRKSHGRIVER